MDVRSLTVATLPAFAAVVPTTHIAFATLYHGLAPLDALVLAGAFPSKSAARRVLAQRGFRVNERVWDDPQRPITLEDTILGLVLVLRVGKRHVYMLVADQV